MTTGLEVSSHQKHGHVQRSAPQAPGLKAEQSQVTPDTSLPYPLTPASRNQGHHAPLQRDSSPIFLAFLPTNPSSPDSIKTLATKESARHSLRGPDQGSAAQP